MAVEARHGLFGDGRIRVDGKRTRVRRDTGGWYIVDDLSAWGSARVLYRGPWDLAVIQWTVATLRIPWRAGEASFVWEEREYHIANMDFGEIRVEQEGRSAARGHVTVAGLVLETVATELLPITRPLGWVLVLRSESLAKKRQ